MRDLARSQRGVHRRTPHENLLLGRTGYGATMKVGLIVTTLVLGWVALLTVGFYSYAVGHSSAVNPTPWLGWAFLGWFAVSATVVIVAIVRAVMASDAREQQAMRDDIRQRRESNQR